MWSINLCLVDPSELRETSMLLKYISNVVYKPLSGLETLTGADVMISPSQFPTPRNDAFILSHIKGGAKLLQLKFGHDLPTSIVDDRIKDAQFRMLKTSTNPWQCGLLFIGSLGYEMATINGQLTYGDHPMKWQWIDKNRLFWIDRGGFIYDIPSGEQIPEHFENIQDMVNGYTSDKALVDPFDTKHQDRARKSNKHFQLDERKWSKARPGRTFRHNK
jgi:hypothetical protein